ncbi:AmmeMemoRadiSam system protein A [Butyrivibrio sp. CB08]|uniref:AmmeMemoRadiSam system protein A n=1 Tax=Butyrivibrio sp. CB08 TaxID=2364879 RepID=UPI000EAA264E|nr:AmmeMemoRadiSam system protein A [Butyrivibrio sp. CB08]RKM59271.1 AmmeMemoRadiSam system protein A [Butyrivibrio sp. CB08]
MPILGAFAVPHPPIMLPEVGGGQEKEIQATTDAYMQVAKEIADLAPETIIISSPHSIMYGDYFHISPGDGARGDMGRFNAPSVSFNEQYDTELVKEICDIAASYGADAPSEYSEIQEFPAGTLGERDASLDHGTMIPLYYIRKFYKDFKIVRIGLSGLTLPMHYEMGQIMQKAIENTGRRVVYVASGDLSHKMKAEGPYGFAKEGPEYDDRIMETLASGQFDRLLDFDDIFCERAAECGHRSFVMMAGALDGLSVRAEKLSHEATFGVGYGICRFEVGEADDSRRFLEVWRAKKAEELEKRKADEDPYVRLARFSLESFITMGKRISKSDLTGEKWADMPSEMFSQQAGAFVSIHKDGALRGCIGTILPTCRNVADEIMQNAISAGTNDPRFPMIREDELASLEMSVDVLDTPEPIDSPDQLDVKRYGVIVTHGRKRGLLLPNLDGVDTIEDQIDIARQKAGISEDEDYSLERFEVIRHY